MKKIFVALAALTLLSACDSKGYERSVAVQNAEMNGADWIVSQDDSNGHPARCWTLHNVSVANEEHSDGLHWQDNTGRLVHISGWYNRVMVVNGDVAGAASQIDITDVSKCHKG